MCQLNLAVMEESKSFTVCCLVCRLIVNLSPTPRRSVAEETHGRSWVGGDGGVIGEVVEVTSVCISSKSFTALSKVRWSDGSQAVHTL